MVLEDLLPLLRSHIRTVLHPYINPYISNDCAQPPLAEQTLRTGTHAQ